LVLAGLRPFFTLLTWKMIETLVRIGTSFWKAAFIDALNGATVLIAGGYCVTFLVNPHYLSKSTYLRSLGQRASVSLLFVIFGSMALLAIASLVLRRLTVVAERCTDDPESRFCWGVYYTHMGSLFASIFGWAFWAYENQASVSAYNSGNFAPLTPLLAVTALVCMLVAISLPAPGREENAALNVRSTPIDNMTSTASPAP
jgi:Ni/Fe-hydrogenase subunit HybB-like protein